MRENTDFPRQKPWQLPGSEANLEGPLVLHLLPLLNPSKYSKLKSFYRYYFGRCSSGLAQLVPVPYSQQGYDKDIYVKSVFLRTAIIWNSLPIESFDL